MLAILRTAKYNVKKARFERIGLCQFQRSGTDPRKASTAVQAISKWYPRPWLANATVERRQAEIPRVCEMARKAVQLKLRQASQANW